MVDLSKQSYVSLEEANNIVSSMVDGSAWLPGDDNRRSTALAQATQYLELYFNWNGQVASNDQPLKWPRINVKDRSGSAISSNSIPNEVKYATVFLSLYLLKNGTVNFVQSNVESLKIGPISLSFDSESDQSTVMIPSSVIAMLKQFGTYEGPISENSAFNVRALR